MLKVYGLKNCDTCKKALLWLGENGIEHSFADLRKDGLSEVDLDCWLAALGWEKLLNKRGTTWRGLPPEDTENLDAAKARALILAHPALIKRPVFVAGDHVTCGFGPAEKAALQKP